MKRLFIIIIIAQRVYGPKIKKTNFRHEEKSVSRYTRKNLFWTDFFHQMYNYQ
jgi:hypothetical protein